MAQSNEMLSGIRLLDRSGFKTPQKVTDVVAAFEAVIDDARPEKTFAATVAAIAAGDTEAAVRHADEYGVSMRVDRSHMHSELASGYGKAIQAAYPSAEAWRFAATAFDAAAKRFLNALGVVDPDASAPIVVNGTKAERETWTEYPAIVAELERCAQLVSAAAKVALIDYEDRHTHWTLPLVVDVANSHRRRVFEAYEDTKTASRGGRWKMLVRLGAILRAASLEDYRPEPPLLSTSTAGDPEGKEAGRLKVATLRAATTVRHAKK